MTKMIRGINKRFRVDGSYIWYIDKRVKRYGRLCESTGTADRKEAERYLLHRLHELREVLIYGERPTRTFKEAAKKYLAENRGKKTIKRDTGTLKDMCRISPVEDHAISRVGDHPISRVQDQLIS